MLDSLGTLMTKWPRNVGSLYPYTMNNYNVPGPYPLRMCFVLEVQTGFTGSRTYRLGAFRVWDVRIPRFLDLGPFKGSVKGFNSLLYPCGEVLETLNSKPIATRRSYSL